ncbi:class I SAM-dependent methyltransferase [Falsiroseomonas sp. HW251]|uniref:class I SAM-dependent methyltransferase n=1 Tax=Falsiroseomonas sp. HW251 TaxID=3390998 RepID=UPI003D31918B
MDGANWSLKDEIAAYWSDRSAGFDDDIAHRIGDGAPAAAWQAMIAKALGPLEGKRVLDLGCGTGEVSRMLRALGASVTGVDLSEAMLARARSKLCPLNWRGFLGDAESLPDRDATYDAVVTRHLVWTLPDAPAAFAAWARVLKPGGRLLVVDGDFVRPTPVGRVKQAIARWLAPPARRGDEEVKARIQAQVHYRGGLRVHVLERDLARAGFGGFRRHDVARVYRAQVAGARLAVRLRVTAWERFAVSAVKG